MPALSITVGPLTEADTSDVIDLIAAQDRRWHAMDPRLAPPSAVADRLIGNVVYYVA